MLENKSTKRKEKVYHLHALLSGTGNSCKLIQKNVREKPGEVQADIIGITFVLLFYY